MSRPGGTAAACCLLLAASGILTGQSRTNADGSVEDDGAALYLDGEGAQARIAGGRVQVSATRFPCARCHGRDGLGGREGGTLMPPIAWSLLSVPTAERAAYDESSLLRAVVDGVGPGGKPLGELMPRYSAPRERLEALLDYLKTVESLQSRGISPNSLAIGAPSGAERRAGFSAAVEQFNREGGAYGRTLSIVPGHEVLIDADTVLETLREPLRASARKALLGALREDGRESVTILGGAPSAALVHELRGSGLELEAEAEAVMLVGTTDAEALSTRTVYAPFAMIGPMLAELMSSGVQVNVAGVGEEAFRWALARERDAKAAEGYFAGLLLRDALLAGGRALTRARLLRQLTSIDLDALAFVTRSR